MGLGLLWGTAVMGMDSAAAGMGSCVPFPCRGCGSVMLSAPAGSPCQQLACSHGQALPVQLLPEPPALAALAARTDSASCPWHISGAGTPSCNQWVLQG